METFAEPLRWTTTLFALVTLAAFARALKPPRRVWLWAAFSGSAAFVFTHLRPGLPSALLLPAFTLFGLLFTLGTLASPRVKEAFERLHDGDWRMLMSLRGVFGALLLAAGATGTMPGSFAVPAGLGDLLAGCLALATPGSLAKDGPRGLRSFVFAVGLVDLVNVGRLMVVVAVPWLRDHPVLGASLLLPWVAVPLLFTVNAAGLKLALESEAPRNFEKPA